MSEALCDVCTDTPQDFLEYGGARELALSAAVRRQDVLFIEIKKK